MQKHSLDGYLAEKSELDRTILDTARTVFETYGVRRANIEDIAAEISNAGRISGRGLSLARSNVVTHRTIVPDRGKGRTHGPHAQ